MRIDDLSRIVEEYCRRRLRAEKRAAQTLREAAELARRIGFSGATLTNTTSEPPKARIGDDVREKLARHWGYPSLEALEADALREAGIAVPALAPSALPELAAALAFMSSDAPHEFLTDARTRAEAYGADRPRREWLAWLDAEYGIWRRERERDAPAQLALPSHPPRLPPGRPSRRKRRRDGTGAR